MPVETVSLFLALLFVGAMVVNLSAVVLGLVRLATGRLPAPVQGLIAELRPVGLVLACLSATVAMLGSLYYSEIAGFTPCKFCWYQRYLMYPSSLILIVALVLKKHQLAWIAFGLSAVGLGVSTYHRAEQQWPSAFSQSCDPLNPCSGKWVDTWGFVTIPTMAFAAFGLVCVFVPLSLLRPKEALTS